MTVQGMTARFCLAIHQAKKNMTSLGLGEGNLTATAVAQAPLSLPCRFHAVVQAAVPATLVLLKVRQNK